MTHPRTDDATPLNFAAPLLLRAAGDRRTYTCRLIRAGRVRRADGSPGPFVIPSEAIEAACDAGRFDARATFIDHAGWFDNPSLHDLAGLTLTATYNEADQSADARVRLYDNPAGQLIATLFDQILADSEAGEPIPDVGLSLVFYPRWKPRDNAGDPLVLAEFRHVESVDFVFQPAADGRVKKALSVLSTGPDGGALLSSFIAGGGRRHRPAPGAGGTDPLGHDTAAGDVAPGPNTHLVETSPLCLRRDVSAAHERNNTMPAEDTSEHTPSEMAPEPEPVPNAVISAASWVRAIRESATQAMIANSGLPAHAQARLRAQHYAEPADVQAAIEAEREYLAGLVADQVVQVGDTPPRGARITLGPTSLEQVQQALDALIEGVRPPDGVRPLTGVRELYTLLSGDYEMTGRFHSDRIYLANVTSSTMAGLVANALNKRVINLFMQYPRWWEPIVVEEDFTSLQQVKWITLGGVGELPTVSEGAAYTELTWDDQTETATFVKKGGYLGITLEAMDKDDTRRLRAAPRALAQAGWLTLAKSVSAIFTDNSGTGPTMADTGALFNATAVSSTGGHANLLTTALSWSEWNVVRLAMMKQAEVNSGERLGALTAPKYCLVPVDLEVTALQILASEGQPGTGNNDENPYAVGDSHTARMRSARSRVIVVPLWTDTNDWAAVADPNLYPSIAIGYRYGRTPEIFSVASPTAGLMFSNDTLPVKVRFFYAVGPTDWRGLHKSNVT